MGNVEKAIEGVVGGIAKNVTGGAVNDIAGGIINSATSGVIDSAAIRASIEINRRKISRVARKKKVVL